MVSPPRIHDREPSQVASRRRRYPANSHPHQDLPAHAQTAAANTRRTHPYVASRTTRVSLSAAAITLRNSPWLLVVLTVASGHPHQHTTAPVQVNPDERTAVIRWVHLGPRYLLLETEA